MSSKVDISLCDIQKIALLVFIHLRAVRLKNVFQAFHFPTAISQYFEIMIVAEIDDG
jgi:hypothetical protein